MVVQAAFAAYGSRSADARSALNKRLVLALQTCAQGLLHAPCNAVSHLAGRG